MADSSTRPTITLELIAERRAEAAFRAFPPDRVPHRLTTDELLMEADRRHARDQRPAVAPLLSYEITEEGSERHRQFGVNFHFADGTSQRFEPHSAR